MQLLTITPYLMTREGNPSKHNSGSLKEGTAWWGPVVPCWAACAEVARLVWAPSSSSHCARALPWSRAHGESGSSLFCSSSSKEPWCQQSRGAARVLGEVKCVCLSEAGHEALGFGRWEPIIHSFSCIGKRKGRESQMWTEKYFNKYVLLE